MSRLLTLFMILASGLSAQERLSPELLWKLGRVSGGQISPDGAQVLYSVRRYELSKNSGDSDLYVVPLEGGDARRLTSGPESESEAQWVQTPRGLRIYFLSRRAGQEATQAWSLDPATGDLLQVTDLAGGIANLKVAPGGRRMAFTVDVKLDATVPELFADLPQADARIIDGLMYRHWNAWHDYAYSHLHVAAIGDDGHAAAATDLMRNLRVDCPVPPFSGSEQIAWSPDGEWIAYTMKMAADWAQSTDSDVYLSRWDGSGERRCVSEANTGYDNDPSFSPDGTKLAWHSMERAGFESDRNRIMVLDLKTDAISEPTKGLDQTVHAATWLPDGKGFVFSSETRGTDQIFRLGLEDSQPKQISSGTFNWSLADVAPDGKSLVCARQSMQRPTELGRLDLAKGNWSPLTDVNGEIFAKLALPKVVERWTRATDGKQIHSWLILPPDFDPEKRYPLITYCQGGPQGQIGQWFSYRWNFHLMAAQGYAVLAVNRRGLPGFGRAWNDEISKDWGGQAMRDILSATDSMLTEPFIDPERTAAVGASFGGYTVYWLMGHAQNRFKAMIAHCGVFNLESMYGSTEELFFANWDLGGPYWKSAELKKSYDAFSPNRFVGAWKTPLLVIHGEKDFRVPVTQGMEAFTAAQVEGVPSRFLYFPNEGHWVMSPQNGVLWHRVFFDWLGRWLSPR